MIVKPKIRGFICTTAHPAGCEANVRIQGRYVTEQGPLRGPKRVLVIGASTGYGLACRLTAAMGCGADTVGVYFERPASGGRTATAGWYNSLAFEKLASENGLASYSINGDAFSDEVKAQVIEAVRELPGEQVDMVIYSLAAPRRTDAQTGQIYNSVIKPVNEGFTSKTVDVNTGVVTQASVEPATEQEVLDTVQVMGGGDWLDWMEEMKKAGVLADNVCTVAFSYIGPVQTHAIYKQGTIGKAKEDLENKARQIDMLLRDMGGKAYVSVNKALVTQASSAIPVVPLYMAMLFKIMKELGTHEDCIQQMVRMFQRMYPQGMPGKWDAVPVDGGGRIRLDDWEMRPEVQERIAAVWDKADTDNIAVLADLEGYREDFSRLFGFGLAGVDYEADVEV